MTAPGQARGWGVRRGRVVSGLLGFLLLLGACGSEQGEPAPTAQHESATPSPTAGYDPVRTPAVSPTATPSPTPTPTPEPTPVPARAAGPSAPRGARSADGVTQMRIPSLGVASAIEAIGVTPANVLDTPKNPYNTGWYWIYDRPGTGGNAVFSAHVDYYPNIRGPFNKLAYLQTGAHIVVVADGRELIYEVFSNQRYSMYAMPMGELLWPAIPEGEEWVTLITCGGRFVSSRPGGPGEYLDRDVVVARRIQ